jgi:hypothetical protein
VSTFDDLYDDDEHNWPLIMRRTPPTNCRQSERTLAEHLLTNEDNGEKHVGDRVSLLTRLPNEMLTEQKEPPLARAHEISILFTG